MDTEQYYTIPKVAAMFEVTPATVREWCKSGLINYIKLPTGRYRIPHSAVVDFAEIKYGGK